MSEFMPAFAPLDLPAASPLYFFGSFNPFHAGHGAIVQAVKAKWPQHALYVVPTGQPPHRLDDASLAAPLHRLAMAQLAVKNLTPENKLKPGLGAMPLATVLDQECNSNGPHYTACTLQTLEGQAPANPIGLILGGDAWRTFATWHQADWLTAYTVPIVIERPFQPLTAEATNHPKSDSVIAAGNVTSDAVLKLNLKLNLKLILNLPMAPHPASATAIRQLLRACQPLPAGWLDSDVMAYINTYSLYQAEE
jgi:nicotinate-nucleotide adenylyltransferase